jgi:hypothetical protein
VLLVDTHADHTQDAWWHAANAARRDVPRPVFHLLAGHGRVWVSRAEAMRALAYVVQMPEWEQAEHPPFTVRF